MGFLEKLALSSEAVQASAVAVIIGGMIWITEIHLTTKASAEALGSVQIQLQELQVKIEREKNLSQQELYNQLKEINQRLSRIEGRLLR